MLGSPVLQDSLRPPPPILPHSLKFRQEIGAHTLLQGEVLSYEKQACLCGRGRV